MYIFLPIITLSALGIVFIFLRKVPEIGQMPMHDASAFYDSWLYKIPVKIKNLHLGYFQELSLNFIEKLLRRFKVTILKAENKTSDWIDMIRKKRKNGENGGVKNGSIEYSYDNKNFIKELSGALSESGIFVQREKVLGMDTDELVRKEKKLLEIIKVNPKDVNTYKELGFLYLKYKNYKDAKSSFEQAVKLGDRDKKVKDALDEIDRYL